MSLAEMTAQIERLSFEELRELAAKIQAVCRSRGFPQTQDQMQEDDPEMIAALEEAIAFAATNPGQGISVPEARQDVAKWASTK
jgi:hypothetical protein